MNATGSGIDHDTDNLVKAQNPITGHSWICARNDYPAFTRCSCLRRHFQHVRRTLMVQGEVSANNEFSDDGTGPQRGRPVIQTCCALASQAQIWKSSCNIAILMLF